MNYRIVDGRLVKDAEVKTKADGSKYLSFTLANNEYIKKESVTTYFSVISFTPFDIDRCEKFTKGDLVVVNGLPYEEIAIVNGKAYLNRKIMANSIIKGTFSVVRENNTPTNTYHDVAPLSPQNESNSNKQSEPINEKPNNVGFYAEIPQAEEDGKDDLPF